MLLTGRVAACALRTLGDGHCVSAEAMAASIKGWLSG